MVDEVPVQILNKRVKLKKTYRKSGEDIDEIIQEHLKPFDISRAPLFRVELLKASSEKHFLFLDFHNIIFDGVSLNIFIRELLEIYHGKELPPLTFQYNDFALWQSSFLQSDQIKKYEEYWLKVFADEIPSLNLFTDYSRRPGQGFSGDRYDFTLDFKLSQELKTLSLKTDTPLFIILLASFNILLSKYTSQEDIITGFPVTGRKYEDLAGVIGLFTTTLPLRNFPSGHKFYRNFLSEVKENFFSARKNQDYPVDSLIEKLNIQRETERNPLFDVVFSFQNSNVSSFDMNDLKIKLIPGNTGTVKFDFTMGLEEKDKDINIYMEYRTALFKEDTIKRMAGHFICLLKDVTRNPDCRLKDINILTEEELKLFHDFNKTDMPYPKDKTVIEIFEEQVKKSPHNTALVYKDKKLTYEELNEHANQLAGLLRNKGIKPDNIVGILVKPSLEMIVGTMGILKSGAAYMPIDFKFPPDRVRYMLEDSNSSILLTQKPFIENLKDFPGEIIDLEKESLYEGNSSNPDIVTKPENLAYIIYTSGSTGKPKGVMIEHSSLINLCYWQRENINLLPSDRVTKYAGFAFDVSVAEIFPTLTAGSSLYIISDDIRMSLKDLNEYYETHGINKIFLPTQFSEHFMELIDNKSLSIVDVAGEKLKHYKKMNYRVFNKYGPTEYTVYTTCFEVDKFYENIPIGKSVGNTKIYILDKNNKLQPPGLPGELCISGAGLARGYLNNPELTAEKFVENPYLPGEKMYRSGDLARWLPDGNIEYLGRMDYQVKIRGFRIEPGEIEQEFLKDKDIRKAVVIDREDDDGNKYLCAYVLAEKKINVEEIKNNLSRELPDYMIPLYIIQLDSFPLNTSGKLDRKALPLPKTDFAEDYIAPRNDMEKKIAEVWKKVLGIKKIGINDNFFSLGGHSLKAVTVVAKLQTDFEITVNDIFKYQTIAALSRNITERKDYLKIKLPYLKEKCEKKTLEDSSFKEAFDCYQKDISKYNQLDLREIKYYSNILLTGATGYIGSHLLLDLLKETESNLYLFVRGSTIEKAEQRLCEKLKYYFKEDIYEKYKDRIYLVKGDLASDRLGLADNLYNEMSGIIDCILHLAADVKHYGHYDDFYKDNVIATKNLLDFAKKDIIKDFHHISTISVAEGRVEGKNYVLFTEEDVDIGQKIETFYGQTKLEAEKLVLSARSEGLPSNIYRVGTAVYHSETGHFQENIEENAFYSLAKSYLNLGVMPDVEEIDFTFVDYVSKAICLLHNRKNLMNETLHIINNNKVNLSALLTSREGFLNIEKYSFSKFIDYLYKHYENPQLKTHIENIMLHKGWFSQEEINLVLLSDKSDIILKKLGFQWPCPDIIKMRPVIQRALLDRINLLQDIPLFSELSCEELLDFACLGKEEYYPDEEDILWEEDINRNLYFIIDGFVEVMKYSKSGWLGTIRVMGPGNFFGEGNIWEESPSGITAEVFMGDARVIAFKGEDFIKLMKDYPLFTVNFVKEVTDRVRKLENIMIEFG